ncbi:MAG: hypothetical protein E6772_16505 [Dysgonomonas sp.]|nr:hypothetical protein [Dysgonomonas sp.]
MPELKGCDGRFNIVNEDEVIFIIIGNESVVHFYDTEEFFFIVNYCFAPVAVVLLIHDDA